MKHLSEFVSTSKDLYRVGDSLLVNLYFYLPLNKNIVFFRRKGEVLVEEDIQKIQQLPKNTLLIHRSEVAGSLTKVGDDISKRISKTGLQPPAVSKDASLVLASIDIETNADTGPTRELAKEFLIEIPKFVENIISKFEKTPSISIYDQILQESKRNSHDLIGAHNAQVSSVSFLMLLTVSSNPSITGQMTINPDSLTNLAAAGLVHDLGLATIPKGIVERHLQGQDDELTVSEKLIFMRHVDATLNLMKNSGLAFAEEVVLAVEYHHENYNGTGFRGIVGRQIPLVARILRIADDLIACINHPRNVFGFREALGHIASKERHLDSPIYDPDIMNALASIE